MSDPLLDSIESAAQQPLKASTDGMSGENHPLSEQVEAVRFLMAQKAQQAGKTGVTRRQIIHSNPNYTP
jgi:hypothetical protein